jgi:hypothetical protein
MGGWNHITQLYILVIYGLSDATAILLQLVLGNWANLQLQVLHVTETSCIKQLQNGKFLVVKCGCNINTHFEGAFTCGVTSMVLNWCYVLKKRMTFPYKYSVKVEMESSLGLIVNSMLNIMSTNIESSKKCLCYITWLPKSIKWLLVLTLKITPSTHVIDPIIAKGVLNTQEKILSFSTPTHGNYCSIWLHFNYF